MKKVAIFVEGQGEQVFVRHLLYYLLDPSKLSFECLRLRSENLEEVPYAYENKQADIYFLIINTQGDSSVLPAIKKREQGLFRQGFHKIIGLRDMYSQAYREISPHLIDYNIMQQFIEGTKHSIATMSQPNKIHFHFAIMELEAWWLCMYTLFAKIDKQLTVAFIAQELGDDLSAIDAEKVFFHPASNVAKILNLVGFKYDKRFSDVERIISAMTFDDIVDVIESDDKRCESFKNLCDDLMAY
ncbi:hypothetical protein [Candidatus Parabeggiatoa sp. HSG14]|uniref:hypothetical protein n=1 Tax=Candidatus Parabeggiatoa sp. HSG14 TaxID=3055593 RepID=UPI0025A838C7|nr:hypothetical protein [Thiotrichales bacterium HSG14]